MKKKPIKPRKRPIQKRSAQMVDDILRGAIRVLKQQGGRQFNTIRVAEETGISVGSLYQYFPNKESILFQVQYEEWLTTSRRVLGFIEDSRQPPAGRLRRMIGEFFQSEWEEVDLRRALAETGVIMDDTEEHQKLKAEVLLKMSRFLAELLPGVAAVRRRFLAGFVFATIGSLAEEVTGSADSQAEVRRYAGSCAEMVLNFLRGSQR
jgi:AcrR family transcriptional regulator